jgi:hypothetical protein
MTSVKKISFKILMGLLCVLASFCVKAQITVQFVPAVSGKNLQGLSVTQLVNSSQQSARVSLSIKIKEAGTDDVVTIKTPGFLLNPGVGFVNRGAFSNATFSFSHSYVGNVVKQTGNLPEGDYEYCFEVVVLESKDPVLLPSYDYCFTYSVQPLTPLLLISPVDEDEMCNKRPSFAWQPPMPLPQGANFRLVLAELKEKQDPVEAIEFNTPLINQPQIRINSLPLPVNMPDLKEGSKYVWQITVYTDKTIQKKSEIWQFQIKCRESNTADDNESYREVKEVLDGHIYYAYGKLRFFFSNPYSDGKLNYKIYSLSDKQNEIKGLPKLNLTNGYDRFELDLSEVAGFQDGKDYLLRVWLADNKMLQLRFVYKEI